MGSGLFCCEKQKEEDFGENSSIHKKISLDENIALMKRAEQILNESMNHSVIQNVDLQNVIKLIFFLEKFEMTYKLYDDFGLTFDPVILFKIDENREKWFSPKSQQAIEDQQVYQLSQNSQMTEHNISQNDEDVPKSKSQKNTITNIDEEGKVYYFNESYEMNVADEENWRQKTARIIVSNSNKTDQHSNIVIGLNIIPIFYIVLPEVEGRIPILNKLNKEVGYIYIRIKMVKSNDPVILDDSNSLPINSNSLIFKDYFLVDFDFLDEALKRRFLIRRVDILQKLKDNEKYIDDEKSKKNQLLFIAGLKESINPEVLADAFFDGLFKNQHIILYGILKFLISKINQKNIIFIDSFLDYCESKSKEQNLFNCSERIFQSENIALLKIYFYFIYRIVDFYREIEIQTELCTNKIDFEMLCEMLLDGFGYLYTILVKFVSFEYEEMEQLKEILYWMLNCMLLLVTPNLAEHIIKLEVLNTLYSLAFNNSIKLLSKPKYLMQAFLVINKESEISALILKIFRKSIQILLDDKNNFVDNNNKPKIISISIRDLILNDEISEQFLVFLQISLTSYTHYPEVFSNVLLILMYFCMDYKYPEVIRKILDNIQISLLCSGFDYYRGNLRKISKNINYFFYKIISHITELNKAFEEEENSISFSKNELREVCNEFCRLFKMKQLKDGSFHKTKTLNSFIKHNYLELHEVICCCAANLTKNIDACLILCKEKCYFVTFIIEYFFELSKDSIKKCLEKFKNNKKEKIPLYISIVDNTILMFNNLITKNNTIKSYFLNILNVRNYTRNKVVLHINNLLDVASTVLSSNNNKLKKTADNFINNYE